MIAGASLAQALPYLAILLAIATFVASQREFGRRAKVDYVDGLEKRITALESEKKSLTDRVEECEKDRSELREENFGLMRRVYALEKGHA